MYSFIKDEYFSYISANLPFVKLAGFKLLDELIGKTDLECAWGKHAQTMSSSSDLIVLKYGFYEAAETLLTADGWMKFNVFKERAVKNISGSLSPIDNSIEVRMLNAFDSEQGLLVPYTDKYLSRKHLITIVAMVNRWSDTKFESKVLRTRQTRHNYRQAVKKHFDINNEKELIRVLHATRISEVSIILYEHGFLI